MTLPNGAVVVSVAWADVQPSGAGTGRGCGMQAHPAGTPLDTLGVAVRCEIELSEEPESPDEPAGPALLLYAPGTVARQTVTDSQGMLRAEAGASMGGFWIVRPAPEGGVLRLDLFDGDTLEWAVFGGTPDEIVDRAGRSALD